MEYYHDTWKLGEKPEKQLKVIIVGAGIAGLVAGLGE
jgi:salicylate hydroxylase